MLSVDILGVRVDDVTYAEALAIMRGAIQARVPHVVTTPNPEFVMLARRDPGFRAALSRAALNIPDGLGLLLAHRATGRRPAARARARHRPGAHACLRIGRTRRTLVFSGRFRRHRRAGRYRPAYAVSR